MCNRKKYRKQYYEDHKEEEKEYQKQYCKDHPEYKKQWEIHNADKRKEYFRQYCIDNAEYKKEYNKQFYIDNPEYNKQYYLKNTENINEQTKRYNQTEAGKANRQRSSFKRRAKIKLLINTLTAEEWLDILKQHKFKCAYCGCEFTLFNRETRDHVMPISKGGNNIKENILPACRSCNSSKSNKWKVTIEQAESDW